MSISDGSGGSAQVWDYSFTSQAPQFSVLPAQVQAMMKPTADASGSYIAPASIFAQQISGLTGTGSVSLDYIPDGATYARVATTDLLTNHIRSPFSGLYLDSNGNITGASGGSSFGTQNVYPIAANRKLAASFYVMMGTTSVDGQYIIGNSVNGYGIKWAHSGGAVTLFSNKASVSTTIATLATVTMDNTKWHWIAIAVTPGSTPGSSDIVEAYFDENHYGPTVQGSSVVTWGSTAAINVVTAANGKISNFRVTGQTL